MGNVFRVINCDGDIEISIYKKANAIFKTNEYNEIEDVCIHKEIINIFDLLKENQKLKKQLENSYCNRTDCAGRIKDSKKYDSLVQAQEAQQKEFIKFLEDELLDARYYARDIAHYIEYVLRKYKEIVNGTEQK